MVRTGVDSLRGDPGRAGHGRRLGGHHTLHLWPVDAAARAHQANGDKQRNEQAAAVFGSDGAFDPTVTRAALATFGAPVLLLGGELDVAAPPSVVAKLAGLFPNATLVIQPGGGHCPWLDDPVWFTPTIAAFLE